MVGLALQQIVEHREGALEVPLGGVNLGERDGRDGGRGGGVFVDRHRVAHALRGLGQVQAAFDDRRDQIAGPAEEASGPGAARGVGARAAQQLVDELCSRQHLGARDARSAGAHDELVSGQGFERRPIHRGGRALVTVPSPSRRPAEVGGLRGCDGGAGR
ncbi:MAG: hypothetical protein MUF34_33305 [Polyangiaceae bacterium]|nr:hypothetical protein [Polyangiaceae bacterium]